MLIPRLVALLALLAAAAFSLPLIILNPIYAYGAAKQGSVAAPNGFLAIRSTTFVDIPEDLSTVKIELVIGDNRYPVTVVEAPKGVARQVWGVIPPGFPPGPTRVDLFIGSVQMTDIVDIAPTAPGIFTANYEGYGPAIATNTANSRIALTVPAIPGQEIALYATGLGGASKNDVSVEVAGQPAIVVAAGAQPDFRGLDQINFIVPQDAFQGCYVPVQLRVRGIASNVATLAINGAPGACSHPFGLSQGELKTLDEGGWVPLAALHVNSGHFYGVTWTWQENVSVAFPQANASLLYTMAGPQMPESQLLGCPAYDDNLSIPVPGDNPDAGTAMTFIGPRSRGLTLPRPFYSSTTPPLDAPFFLPGQWQLSGQGGADLPAFSHSLTVPPVPTDLNFRQGDRFPAGQGLTLTWNPSGYSATDMMVMRIGGGSYYHNGRLEQSPFLACRVRAKDGILAIPQAAMDPLGSVPMIRMTVLPDPSKRVVTKLTRADGTAMTLYSDYQFTYTAQVTLE